MPCGGEDTENSSPPETGIWGQESGVRHQTDR
jgi:hypothetical protein